MLVSGADDVLEFVERQPDGVLCVPLKDLVAALLFGESTEAKLGGKTNGAIITATGFQVAFPNFLDAGTWKGHFAQVLRSANAIGKRFSRDLTHLSANPAEQPGGGRILNDLDLGEEARFIGNRKRLRLASNLLDLVGSESVEFVHWDQDLVESGFFMDRVRKAQQPDSVFDPKVNRVAFPAGKFLG